MRNKCDHYDHSNELVLGDLVKFVTNAGSPSLSLIGIIVKVYRPFLLPTSTYRYCDYLVMWSDKKIMIHSYGFLRPRIIS